MSALIKIGDITISVTRKDVKNVHLSVHPPTGRVTLVAPTSTRLDVARAYAITKVDWIKRQRAQLESQSRETPRKFVTRETHYLWGRRYLLKVTEEDARPQIRLDHRTIHLQVRPRTSRNARARVIHAWHLQQLHAAIPDLIGKWEAKAGVRTQGYYLQRMKTKWGSCNKQRGTIRLNTELVKKPRDLIEYVIVHEIAHMLEPSHGPKFVAILDKLYPSWVEARRELNELPIPTT